MVAELNKIIKNFNRMSKQLQQVISQKEMLNDLNRVRLENVSKDIDSNNTVIEKATRIKSKIDSIIE